MRYIRQRANPPLRGARTAAAPPTPSPNALKKSSAPKAARLLDKHLYEAGQQCLKRLWFDCHDPSTSEPGPSRQAMSAVGDQLRTLARSVFPKGVLVTGATPDAAAEATKRLLAEGTSVLFDATFVADGVEARADILVQHRDGSLDVYEIKSGTRINPRYVNDLALQVVVITASGLKVRAAFLLHVNPKYAHKADSEFPPMQLLRSADVTAKVERHVAGVRRKLQQFRQVQAAAEPLQLPMGTYCTAPFPCPYLARCAAEAPAQPLRLLPELTRQLETELHKEGIEDLAALDPARNGLSFRQRRYLTCLRDGKTIVEPFVREELNQCARPLHFLAIAYLPEPLPRFDGQRPWRQMPFGWAATTLHPDGRLESGSFAHVDRTDPRPGFATSLAKHLEVGGTVICWDDEGLSGLRGLLDDLPDAKNATRAIMGRPHLDMMHLLEAGVFHPELSDHRDLRKSVKVLLDDASGADLPIASEDALREVLAKAGAPRVRSATKEKLAGELVETLKWQSERLMQLFVRFAEVELPRKAPVEATPKPKPKAPPKPLPKT